MSKLNGHGNGHDRENVTSLDEARRRSAEKAKAAAKAKVGNTGFTAKQMLVGGMIIVMAIGYLVSLVMRATTAINGGAA
jgi:hypothetical protein